MTASPPTDCAYCLDDALDEAPDLLLLTPLWRVAHGPSDSTRAGGVKITSRRHFTDFADMDPAEQSSFGPLLHRVDVAIRDVTGAERVHLVSTRDRVPHFHAWLYPRHATDSLRGTTFLAAPQSSSADEAAAATAALRAGLRHDDGSRGDA